MHSSSKIFVGITTWNSELLLPLCLESLRLTAPDAEIVVLDNESTDETQNIVRSFGARLVVQRCGQSDALSTLAQMSNRPYTLLIHADIVLLASNWVEIVLAQFTGNIALVSPEDIGCGPLTRPWGRDKPESSFMCFDTRHLKKIQVRRWYRRFRIPYFRNKVDFYGDHITYNLPDRLANAGLTWRAMRVHPSDYMEQPGYKPAFPLKHWREDLGHLRYGLGNFYSIGEVVTHYHNWYDRRVERTKQFGEQETLEVNGDGVPVAYLKIYTDNFIADYKNNRLRLPDLAAEVGQ